MKRIYVAGPISLGDQFLNVRKGIEAAHKLADLGFVPFCPHLTCYWHTIFPRPWQSWLEMDEEWLSLCHAVLRLPGESKGADREVALAEKLGIPVFHTLASLTDHFATKK